MNAIFIVEGVDEKKAISKAAPNVYIHFHKHREICNDRCYFKKKEGNGALPASTEGGRRAP